MVLLLERCMHFPNVSLIERNYLFLAASSLAIPFRKLSEHDKPVSIDIMEAWMSIVRR